MKLTTTYEQAKQSYVPRAQEGTGADMKYKETRTGIRDRSAWGRGPWDDDDMEDEDLYDPAETHCYCGCELTPQEGADDFCAACARMDAVEMRRTTLEFDDV